MQNVLLPYVATWRFFVFGAASLALRDSVHLDTFLILSSLGSFFFAPVGLMCDSLPSRCATEMHPPNASAVLAGNATNIALSNHERCIAPWPINRGPSIVILDTRSVSRRTHLEWEVKAPAYE
jgi:hypothetical protein